MQNSPNRENIFEYLLDRFGGPDEMMLDAEALYEAIQRHESVTPTPSAELVEKVGEELDELIADSTDHDGNIRDDQYKKARTETLQRILALIQPISNAKPQQTGDMAKPLSISKAEGSEG